MYAMDYCQRQHKAWADRFGMGKPNYDLRILTNRQIN
jgi:hypothetical protein